MGAELVAGGVTEKEGCDCDMDLRVLITEGEKPDRQHSTLHPAGRRELAMPDESG